MSSLNFERGPKNIFRVPNMKNLSEFCDQISKKIRSNLRWEWLWGRNMSMIVTKTFKSGNFVSIGRSNFSHLTLAVWSLQAH